jgi:UDP-N-acetylmuramate dehydrogenase
MNIADDKKLANYVTMRIGGFAKLIVEVSNEFEIVEAVNYAKSKNLKLMCLGGGSNIVFSDNGFDGLVIINKIPGLMIDKLSGVVRLGAGTKWHDVVLQTVESGLVGIEALALIPGTCGATPVNNIGAYGQELKDVFLSLRAFDIQTNQFVEIQNSDCNFSYRNSRFKSNDYGRFIISSITLQLKPKPEIYIAPQYPALTNYLNQLEIYYPSPENVMRSVIAIRSTKLPDPAKLANCGSFFKNPIVDTDKMQKLLASFPSMPHYPTPDGREKLSAGWLIDTAGLKNYRQDGMWVYDKQALVLVNENAHSFKNLASMVEYIQSTIQTVYGISLEPEPEIII